jgi:hypothetical protein
MNGGVIEESQFLPILCIINLSIWSISNTSQWNPEILHTRDHTCHHSDSHKHRSIIVMGANLRPPGEQTASVGELVGAVVNLEVLSRPTSRMALAAEITPAP